MAKNLFYKVLITGNLLIVPAVGVISAQSADPSLMPVMQSPLSTGFLERARAFAGDGNWEGVIDQVRLALAQSDNLSRKQLEELAYLNIVASCREGLFTAPALIEEFLADYAASTHAAEVRFLQANLLFYAGDYGGALRAYDRINLSTLPADLRNEYTYKRAISMLKTGYYAEARPLFAALSGESDYAVAVDFYDAYIDYVNGDYNAAYRKFSRIPETDEKGLEAEYYLAQIDFKNGDFKKVAKEGELLLAKEADATLLPETMRIVGISNFKLGNTDKAATLLEEYLNLTGEMAENSARYTLGTIYYDRRELEKAKEQFSLLTDDRNDLAQSSWLYLGQIAATEGDDGQAAIAFANASKMAFDPKVAETALYNQAVIGATGGGAPFVSSSETLENFVATYPDSSYAGGVSSYLAASYYNDRDYEKALRSIDRIPNPSDDVLRARQKILYELGMKQFAAGELDKAVVSLSEAASRSALDPEIAAQAYLWLGDAYYRKGRYNAAAEAYNSALATKKTGSNTAITQYNLGYALMKLKDYKGAMSHFKAAVATDGLTSTQLRDAKLRIADCAYYTGNHREALAGFRALKGGKDQDAVYAALREAELVGYEGDNNTRIAILKGIDETGNAGIWNLEVLTSLAGAYSEAGDDANAAIVNARILDSNPSESTAVQTLYSLAENADKLYNREDYDAALTAYRKLEQSGNPEFYPQALAGIMRSSSSSDEIINYADRILATPGLPAEFSEEARFNKAVASIDLNRDGSRERGLKELRKLAENPSREWGAMAALSLAQYYLDAGNPKEAEKEMLSFVDSNVTDEYLLAKGYILLSDAYSAQGNDYLARLYLQTLRENYPGNETEIYEMIKTRLNNLE